MAKIGIKNLTWAQYKSGGEGSAIVYENGIMMKDYMVRGELTIENGNVHEYADDHRIDTDSSTSAVGASMELANMTARMMEDFAGMVAVSGSTGEYYQTDGGAPYLGCGWEMVNRYKGEITYEGVWIYKIRFHQDSVSADTKTDSLTFGHENVAGDGVGVQLTEGGAVVYYAYLKGAATEAAVETWLKGKAGVAA